MVGHPVHLIFIRHLIKEICHFAMVDHPGYLIFIRHLHQRDLSFCSC